MIKKAFSAILMVGLIPGLAFGQAKTLPSKPDKIQQQPADTAYSVIERGPHHSVWERTTYELGPTGEAIPKQKRFIELSTGLNFQDMNGQWIESQEIIEPCPGGAMARHGQHIVVFANNLATAGAIDLTTSDGKRLRSHILGLSYFDTVTGKNVIIAEIKDCQGKIFGNQVIYEDAFTDVKASVRYTYTKAGFEQDVITEGQLPDCEQYGLKSNTTVLQVLTEFIDPPEPTVARRESKLEPGVQIEDQDLDFGSLKMIRGKAFSIGNAGLDSDVPVSKQWLKLNGRNVLVEQISLPEIKAGLQALPDSNGASIAPIKDSVRHVASNQRLLPKARTASLSNRKMETASLSFQKEGLVIDYATLTTSATNYVFQADTTYFISGTVNLYGSNVWEGNTVLKFASNASVNVVSGILPPSVNFKTGLYRPAVFMSKDDNTSGETISGSTGNPQGYYANPALGLSGCGVQTVANVRFVSARQAVSHPGTTLSLSHAQFVGCQTGISLSGSTNYLRNALFANTKTNFAVQSASVIDVENATLSGSAYMVTASATGSILSVTNCILASVTNLSSGTIQIYGQNNGFYNSTVFGNSTVSSATFPFLTANGGRYYLPTQSVFHVAGTTNIDASLLAAIKARTTYAPIVFTNITFSGATNFNPQATRDTGTPDLGYHYDPLDYIFGGCTANSNMTFTAGTAVGWFRASSGWYHAGHGITIADRKVVSFNGTLNSPCYWARSTIVQESGSVGYGPGGMTGWADQYSYDPTRSPEVRLRFTRCSMLAGESASHFRDDYGYLMVRAQDCEIWGGFIGGYIISTCFTNSFMDRAPVGNGTAWPGTVVYMRNCFWRGGSFGVASPYGDMPVTLMDCAFDGAVAVSTDYNPSDTSVRKFSNNAYLNGSTQTVPAGTNDIIVTNFLWKTGPLGDYYQLSTDLRDKGCRTADLAGLYHYTTQTNQVKETNSLVDIGYHYMAVDSDGQASDSDGDGTPDYIEDTNGNGVFDAGDAGDYLTPNLISSEELNIAIGFKVLTPLK